LPLQNLEPEPEEIAQYPLPTIVNPIQAFAGLQPEHTYATPRTRRPPTGRNPRSIQAFIGRAGAYTRQISDNPAKVIRFWKRLEVKRRLREHQLEIEDVLTYVRNEDTCRRRAGRRTFSCFKFIVVFAWDLTKKTLILAVKHRHEFLTPRRVATLCRALLDRKLTKTVSVVTALVTAYKYLAPVIDYLQHVW